jgi:hypothetical protein
VTIFVLTQYVKLPSSGLIRTRVENIVLSTFPVTMKIKVLCKYFGRLLYIYVDNVYGILYVHIRLQKCVVFNSDTELSYECIQMQMPSNSGIIQIVCISVHHASLQPNIFLRFECCRFDSNLT